MSQSTPATQDVVATSTKPGKGTVIRSKSLNCAVVAGSYPSGPIIAASPDLVDHRITAKFVFSRSSDDVEWNGIRLNISLGAKDKGQESNEANGRGVVFTYNAASNATMKCDHHVLDIQFPRGGTTYIIDPIPEDKRSMFKDGVKNKPIFLIKCRLAQNTKVFVKGFGLPFANGDDAELEAWVNHTGTITEAPGVSMLSFLRQREFHVVVVHPAALERLQHELSEGFYNYTPAFSYTDLYGTEHNWDMERAGKLIQEHKSDKQFNAVTSFLDDHSHVTVLTQCVVQDIYWILQDADRIAKRFHEAYFVPMSPGSKAFFVVVMLPRPFRTQEFKAAWPTLADCLDIRLTLKVNSEAEGTVEWRCILMEHPESRPALKSHAIEPFWSVFRVQPSDKDLAAFKMKVHENARDVKNDIGSGRLNQAAIRFALDTKDEERKVDAACQFLPGALPTSFGLTHGKIFGASLSDPTVRDKRLTDAEIADRMELCRSVWRGAGFWDWMNKPGPSLTAAMDNLSLHDFGVRCLPMSNMLAGVNDRFREILLNQALPEDREPLGKYLSARPLGIAIVSAAPGFGKTSVLALAGVALRHTYGPVLCSGPSNAAISNLANRLDTTDEIICKQYNEGRAAGDGTRARRSLVVRAFRSDQDWEMLKSILFHPDTPWNELVKGQSKWTLFLTPVFWLLLVMGSPLYQQTPLGPDDNEFLLEHQSRILARSELNPIKDVIAGKMAMSDLSGASRETGMKALKVFMGEIADNADILCTTPSVSSKDDDAFGYLRWKQETARAVLVDEAGNMNRPDMYCVAGNVLLPLVMGGDRKQLRPVVTSEKEKDADGKFQNRMAKHGQVSALDFIQSSGIPVYQLKKQLRMAEGLFDWIGKDMYPELGCVTYGPQCSIDHDKFKNGHNLEAFLQERFPEIQPPPAGKLWPAFVHCRNSFVRADLVSGGRLCKDQCNVAIGLVKDLVQAEKLTPSNVAILARYKANVEFLQHLLRQEPSLKGMEQPSTVDAYQGRERDVVFVVLGTAPRPLGFGAGFTTDENRLNVMMTRQVSGLVLAGDIAVTTPHDDKKKRPKDDRLPVVNPLHPEKMMFASANMLKKVYQHMVDEKRVGTVVVREDKVKEEKKEDKPKEKKGNEGKKEEK